MRKLYVNDSETGHAGSIQIEHPIDVHDPRNQCFEVKNPLYEDPK